jgi:transposase-like protein
MNTRWSNEEKTTFTALWKQRKTVAEIAMTMGKSESAVKNQRRALDLAPRRTGDLTEKVRVGLHPDEHALLYKKALRNNQTLPGRIRALVQKDLAQP